MSSTPVPQRGSHELRRLSNALEIYNRSFRDYLSAVLRTKLGPNWWRDGVVRRISTIQEDIEKHGFEIRTDDEAVSVLEPKHYHQIVRVHREYFPKLSRFYASHIAKTGGNPRTLMHEVADWRNVNAHPPRNLNRMAVDRAVEAMVRLVCLFDSAAHDELSKLAGRREIDTEEQQGPDLVADAQREAERIVAEAKQEARAIRSQAQNQDKKILSDTGEFLAKERRETLPRSGKNQDTPGEKKAAQSELRSVRNNIMILSKRVRELKVQEEEKAKDIREAEKSANAIRMRAREQRDRIIAEGERAAKKARMKADSLVEKAHRDAKEAEKQLLEARRRADETRAATTLAAVRTQKKTERGASRSGDKQVGRESSAPEVSRTQEPSNSFRERFKPARSGNGHLRSLRVDGWWLNCWVGITNGLPRASVFAPTKTINGRRVEAQDTPLMGSSGLMVDPV